MIFCVDDDNTIRELEVYTLRQMGFQAQGFPDGASMLEALGRERPELILLDIMLPGENGVDLLKRLRRNPDTEKIPVIMATAKGTEMDKIQGLDTGADDYLVKPFSLLEMVSRVKAVLRRYSPERKESLSMGPIQVEEESRQVTVFGQRVELTYKEFEILRRFIRHPGRVFSREQLLQQVWGSDYLGESRTVDMHIKNLRHKLGAAGKMIETVIGVGYRMEEKP